MGCKALAVFLDWIYRLIESAAMNFEIHRWSIPG